MKLSRFGLVLFTLFFLPACAQLATLGGDFDAYLDRLISNKEYAAALEALDASPQGQAKSPSLKTKRDQVLALIAGYEKTFSQQTNVLLKQQRWSELETLIQQAERSIGDSAHVEKARQRLDAKKEVERQELKFKRTIAEGEWVLLSLPLDESIYKLSPYDASTKSRVRYGKYRARELVDELAKLGELASTQGELSRAQKACTLALRLVPVLDDEAASQRLSNQIKLENQKLKAKQKAQKEHRFVVLLDKIKVAREQSDLVKRLALVRLAEKLNRNDPRLVALRRQLDEEVIAAIAAYQEQGNTQYSQGNYEQAIADWRRVLALDPKNELAISNIARAERVLENLQKLREKQQVE